jgi:hypothetical protein
LVRYLTWLIERTPEKLTVEEDERPAPDVNVAVMGTVKLSEGSIVYIPTPTADPRGKESTSPGL